MNIETERRFLVNSNELGLDISHVITKNFKILCNEEIEQYYFKNNTKEISQRVRAEYFCQTQKTKYTLNIKSNIDGLSRYEFEKRISENDYYYFTEKCCNKCLKKFRVVFEIEGNKWEFNFIPNKGLLIAEIELKDKNQQLDIPFKYEKEITYDSNYLAESLAE